jgi:hypothetical protein
MLDRIQITEGMTEDTHSGAKDIRIHGCTFCMGYGRGKDTEKYMLRASI